MRFFDIFDFFDNTKSYSKAISPNFFFKLRKSTSHRFATTEPLNATRHELSKILKNTPPPISFINQKIREKETYSRVETIFQNYFPLRYTHREKNSLGSRSSESSVSNRKARFDLTGPITNPPHSSTQVGSREGMRMTRGFRGKKKWFRGGDERVIRFANCSFSRRRLLFSPVPLRRPTTRSLMPQQVVYM